MNTGFYLNTSVSFPVSPSVFHYYVTPVCVRVTDAVAPTQNTHGNMVQEDCYNQNEIDTHTQNTHKIYLIRSFILFNPPTAAADAHHK